MNDGKAGSVLGSPAASPFGDVKRLSVPVSPPRTKSGSGLPASPGLPKSPAKPVSPFYSTRMKDTAETSAATALFRKGAEQIVLDHDKQAKLANLIKAVTKQKMELTEEREQAIAGFKAERAKLRTMQQKTLTLYARMKSSEIQPVSVGVRDVADSSDDEEGASGAGSYDMARTAGSIFASLRGLETKSVFQRWSSFAKQRAAAEAHVRRMQRRWELSRMAKMARAWWRLAVKDAGGLIAAAEASSTRLKKRIGRKAFSAWRGVAAGLSEEELAKLSSASAQFVAGSPAAGLIAVAQLARSRGGTDAGTRRRIVAEAVAAADRSAGAFDVEDILGGAAGTEAFFSPNAVTVSLEDEVDKTAATRAAAIMFGKTTRGMTRNVIMAWSAWAARASAARAFELINTLRFEQAEAEAAGMVAAEEKDALVAALAESEKKAKRSKSFFSSPFSSSKKTLKLETQSLTTSPAAKTATASTGVSSPPVKSPPVLSPRTSAASKSASTSDSMSVNTPATSQTIASHGSFDSSATSSAKTPPAKKPPVTDVTESPEATSPRREQSSDESSEGDAGSSSSAALPLAPDSPTSTSSLETPLLPAPEVAPADVTDVKVESKEASVKSEEAAKTWSEDPPVEVPPVEKVEEKEADGKNQPACCVIM